MEQAATQYNTQVVKYFVLASLVWAIAGMIIGVILAAQLYWPVLNFDSQYFQFGRLRPLHTSGVIYGFVVNILMGTSLYIAQRTGRCNLFNQSLSWMVFWGWQLVLFLALVTLPAGYTTSKEYAELEWPIDVLIVLVWVLYAVLFFGTIAKRKVDHIFVANWFFAAFIIVIAMIFIVNNLAMPVSLMKSYSVFAGAQDAIVQWWWGHNAVGFLLTAGVIGMNYYFIPKAADRPIYSYRLSVIHFWGLVGFYTWAGTHHLVYSSVPVWVQNIGIIMSLILWLPSWAGAFNSAMTLLQNKEKLKSDYICLFFFSAILYYCLATFEGPLLAIRWFNMLAHNTEWVIGHVHSGALGWVGMSGIAVFYYFIPRLWNKTELWSQRLIKWHFWLAHAGVAIYAIALWVAGIGEGYMWLTQNENGELVYSFIEAMNFKAPWLFLRFFGGALFVLGLFLMAFNLYKTVRSPSVLVAKEA
ncbi:MULTISPECIES: cytochrome-c oxidase, cbb3-type subunit I [Vibrio]|jgi:cytochrome c oxidase cbb3-type subunit 1|uniref:cytochrome-c oxidase n=1 Tax=Vibrio harveyi TaxID=669 RepID=A0ABM5Y4W1_VIBHA|nr:MULTISPECIES: cytochrome-c oxidase, cbb3-type subunit I [Vibrio]AMG00668.1 cytochrome-c oxidase, cbb3-type subunit I [Vibrio harveyi]EKM23059.1 cytochrome c oxidase, cbb3-type, subunit I [Vibrio harveyi]EKO3782162.1 cytochrome-c oxidase, cbb3-type subunit I [Vibrio harveyi]EKO3808690.1 cytochrome-c oxidase, cbb3-type subunit I [Vibrio harveyi]EKO3819114.1 cytochrome-c oxidase, cbb3-type subunit I [Vibrio harveyi]